MVTPHAGMHTYACSALSIDVAGTQMAIVDVHVTSVNILTSKIETTTTTKIPVKLRRFKWFTYKFFGQTCIQYVR